MATMVPEVITNALDFTQGFRKYMTHGVNKAKEPSRTSLYLEDALEIPDHPDAGHDDDCSWQNYMGGTSRSF